MCNSSSDGGGETPEGAVMVDEGDTGGGSCKDRVNDTYANFS